MDVTIQLGVHGAPALISAAGVLDVHSAPGFRETVARLLEVAGPHPRLDTSGLDVRDHAGAAALQWLQRHSREFGGSVRPAGDDEAALRVGGG
ncbi:STAS domain-containing protein [uncultured Cellulomonas sp.]|uniref:STAS domain-containing protein n=1 Tax=uncultured Cellulomonas sp. TaxID=189682 RepID=UPI0028E7BEE0|nr:STAS domain-containing protein [uncultured Cellulomonas sp.]